MKAPPKYLIATDIGGTCTDTIVFAAGEPVHLGKTLSTPPNFSVGVINFIRSASESMGLLLSSTWGVFSANSEI
jgi:N-methylhydantoinase A